MNKEFKNQLPSYETFNKGLISRRLKEEPKRRKNKTKTKIGKFFSFFLKTEFSPGQYLNFL